MLIREVIKHTPHDSSDLKALEVAFEKIQNLAAEINESKRRMEQQVWVFSIFFVFFFFFFKKKKKKKKKKKIDRFH